MVTALVDALNSRHPAWVCAALTFMFDLAALVRLFTTDRSEVAAAALPIAVSIAAGVLAVLVHLEAVSAWKANLGIGTVLILVGPFAGGIAVVACLVPGIAVTVAAVHQVRTERSSSHA